MALLGGMRQQEMGVPAEVTSVEQPEIRFATQLRQLQDMGFYNPVENVQALQMTGGNVEAALEWLFSRPG